MRLTTLITALTAIIMTSCSNQNSSAQSRILVAYFSATGTTETIAKRLANVTGGDISEIVPAQPYTAADLDWTNDQSRSSLEMRDLSSRPAIKSTVSNISQYDTIYIGFPIWWYTAPTIINTWIEAHDLKGKKLILFATSGGSSIDRSIRDLKNTYPTLNWAGGKLLNRATETSIRQWVNSL